MQDIQNSLSNLWQSLIDMLPGVIGALVLLLVAWLIATIVKKAVVKGLEALNMDEKFVKWGVASTQSDGNRLINSIGKIFYYLIFLFFIPGILSQIGLSNIAMPITNMFDTFLAFLPKLFGAAIILAIGYFVAKFVRELVQNLLEAINVDRWVGKMSGQAQAALPTDKVKEQKNTIAKVLANVVFIVVLIPVITIALDTLQIDSIAQPIENVLNMVLAAIPNIIVAIILLIAGGFIAKLVGDLVEGLLSSSGVDRYSQYLNMSGKPSSTSISKIIAQVLKVVIMIFFLVEALNVLNLEVLNTIGTAIIAYLPSVLIGLIILALGIFGGNALAGFVKDSTGSAMTATIVKYILYVLAIFMTLDQLQFASTIVNTAFLFIIGGLAVAFALSFGLGGREFASRQLERLDKKMMEESAKPGSPSTPDTPKPTTPPSGRSKL